MQVVCIQAHGDLVPGDLAEIPDGADYSPVHFAAPGSPEALAAETAATAPSSPAGGDGSGSPPPGPGTIRVPGSTPPPSSPASSAPASASKETVK